MNLNNRNERKSDIFPWEIFKSDTFFYQNILKYFNDFQNQNLNFMTKMNQNNGNETKSDIFPRDILKSDIIFIGRKILKYFNHFYDWHFPISLQK